METAIPLASVLLVDDDADLLDTLNEWLCDSGYRTVLASCGLEAIAHVRSHPPDVMVTDLRMPGLDGLALLNSVKELAPATQVIVLSGQATLEDAVAALREGRGFDLLQKPLIDLQRLNTTIERALAQRQAQTRLSQATATALAPVTQGPSLPERVLAYVRSNLKEPLKLRDVAAALGYSANYLTDAVRKETGLTVQQWIIHERLAAAEVRLATTNDSVAAIAEVVGYTDPAYFTRQFRLAKGVTPQAWRHARHRDRG